MSEKTAVKAQLVSSALALFTDYHVKQDELFKWIRDAITESVASRPKQRIIYNAVHGGFSLSQEFEQFIRSTVKYNKIREHAAKHMQSFAQYLLNKPELAGLREHLYAYDTTNLHEALTPIIELYYTKPKLANLAINMKALDEYLANPNASRDVKPTLLKPTVSYLASEGAITRWCPKYNRSELKIVQMEARQGTYKRELETKVAQAEAAAVSIVGREVLEDFLLHYDEVSKYESNRGQKRKTFIALLQEKGYKDDISVWKAAEDSYDLIIITYIIKRNLRSDPPADAAVISCIEEKFGLACASGTYANLAIADIPDGVSWRIHEYDGLENVYIV